MEDFLKRHAQKITAVLSCFDRLVFKGYLPFCHPRGMENFLDSKHILYKNFKSFCTRQRDRLQAHAQATARHASRPLIYLNRFVRKEDLVQKIRRSDGITSGLICILQTLETTSSFALRYGQGKPRLQAATRRSLVLYYYFLDPEFGLMHVRIQTWLPFTVQVCLNGHEWLARKMDRHGVGYRKLDNAFLSLQDPQRAQRLADAMTRKDWPRVLQAFARKVNPLLGDLLQGLSYYFVTDQAEFSTDLIFQDRASLHDLYPRLLRHATLCFSAEDVLSFLGRKLHPNFQGEVLTDCKKRIPGARVKHRMTQNWIKMYDKFGVVLRIETVINRPYEFRVRRRGRRQGKLVTAWLPLTKGVGFLFRYREVCLAANRSYLKALAQVEDPSEAYHALDQVCHPVAYRNRRRRGLNPLRMDDLRLFAAVLRGENTLHGFRNRDLVQHLDTAALRNPKAAAKARARVTRLIQLLRAHQLISKIPRSRRYRITPLGARLMSAAVYLRHEDFPDLLQKRAA